MSGINEPAGNNERDELISLVTVFESLLTPEVVELIKASPYYIADVDNHGNGPERSRLVHESVMSFIETLHPITRQALYNACVEVLAMKRRNMEAIVSILQAGVQFPGFTGFPLYKGLLIR